MNVYWFDAQEYEVCQEYEELPDTACAHTVALFYGKTVCLASADVAGLESHESIVVQGEKSLGVSLKYMIKNNSRWKKRMSRSFINDSIKTVKV